MARKFTSFVILGAMRTGSNFLEASLSELAGVTTYGEVFNPHFIGNERGEELFDITLPMREADPVRLLDRIRASTDGLPGFRYFQGHDPRILEAVLADPTCAKIVLTRNPLDSFISLGIALKTKNWMITDEAARRAEKVRFDGAEFAGFLDELDAFYCRIRHALRTSGQTAFEIGYDDLADVDVLNGLASWLGVTSRLKAPSSRLKRQNPADISQKVTNPGDIQSALAGLDLLAADRPRERVPERNAAIRSYLAAPEAPLLYLPVRGGPVSEVEAWLAALDSGSPKELRRDFGLGTLRDWRRANPGHRSFTVIRHPLARAHHAFCRHLLMPGPECYGNIRALMGKNYWIEFPEAAPGPDYSADRHRRLFLGFLQFLKKNLAGLTSIRIDPSWASQEMVLRGFSKRQLPDMVIREDRLEEGLAQIAAQIGRDSAKLALCSPDPGPYALGATYDAEVEAAAHEVYANDYEAFGFTDWRPLRRP